MKVRDRKALLRSAKKLTGKAARDLRRSRRLDLLASESRAFADRLTARAEGRLSKARTLADRATAQPTRH